VDLKVSEKLDLVNPHLYLNTKNSDENMYSLVLNKEEDEEQSQQ